MLVDDDDFLEDVRRATDAFAAHQLLPFKVSGSRTGDRPSSRRPDAFAALPDAL